MEGGALQMEKGDNRESGFTEPGLQGASTCGMNRDTTRETKGRNQTKKGKRRRDKGEEEFMHISGNFSQSMPPNPNQQQRPQPKP